MTALKRGALAAGAAALVGGVVLRRLRQRGGTASSADRAVDLDAGAPLRLASPLPPGVRRFDA